MANPLTPEITAALTGAVRELEARSCAEVVVEIRTRSGSYAQAHARFASLLAFAALLLLLFSPWPFRAISVAADVALTWLLGVWIARKSDAIRRLMTSPRERLQQARTTASAVFHDRGVANTRDETGVLVYLSLMEEHIEVLADRGVLARVPALEWNRVIETARDRHASAGTLVEVVRAMMPLLEQHLPAREGDVDELCNVPRFVSEE